MLCLIQHFRIIPLFTQILKKAVGFDLANSNLWQTLISAMAKLTANQANFSELRFSLTFMNDQKVYVTILGNS